jgi:hypothetical protein
MHWVSNPALAAGRVTGCTHFRRLLTSLGDGGGFVTRCMSARGHRSPICGRPTSMWPEFTELQLTAARTGPPPPRWPRPRGSATASMGSPARVRGRLDRRAAAGIDDEGVTWFAAMRTPPWPMLASEMHPETAPQLIEARLKLDPGLSGLGGPEDVPRCRGGMERRDRTPDALSDEGRALTFIELRVRPSAG